MQANLLVAPNAKRRLPCRAGLLERVLLAANKTHRNRNSHKVRATPLPNNRSNLIANLGRDSLVNKVNNSSVNLLVSRARIHSPTDRQRRRRIHTPHPKVRFRKWVGNVIRSRIVVARF